MARDGLVEHQPNGVPVGRGREWRAAGLLRRHVRRRANDRAFTALVGIPNLGRHHPEIEDEHVPRPIDQHIRWLQIAMQDPRTVQRKHAGDELRKTRAEPRQVDAPIDHMGRVHAFGTVGGSGSHDDGRRRAGLCVLLGLRRGDSAQRVRIILEAPDPGVEANAIDEVHGETPARVDRKKLMQSNEVGMPQVCERPELLLESIDG